MLTSEEISKLSDDRLLLALKYTYEQHKSNLSASADPDASNSSTSGYSIGSIWVNITGNPRKAFLCVDATVNAAVWMVLGGAGPGGFTVQQNAVFNSLSIIHGSAAMASAVWPTANLAFYIPLTVQNTVTVKRIIVLIGGVTSGNLDVGIYNETGARQVSMGSTAMGAASTAQVFDIADTVLTSGRYYLAIAVDNITGTTFRAASSAGTNTALGVKEQAAAFPLPDPATFAETNTRNHLPNISVTLET